MRKLAPEEAQLWAKVTASIRPLSRDGPSAPAIVLDPVAAAPAPKTTVRVAPAPVRRASAPPPPRPGTTLDGSWDRKLGKGAVSPDRILDLHGHSLDSAWHAIDQTLGAAIDEGARVVLLVTGHQPVGAPPIERGRIRAAVNDWLAVSRHARRIAAVRAAHPRHGGGGSLYIILRRA